MAEGGTEATASSGWWGNFVSVAKNKSAEVLEFMKRDFDEISHVVKNEAATIANHTAVAVKETLQLDKEESTANMVKRSVSSLFGSVKEALSPSPSVEFEEALIIRGGSPVAMTPLQRKIHALVSDEKVYLTEISEEERCAFEAWLGVMEETLTSSTRLSHLLSIDPTLQDMYTKLVPDQVSHSEFWQRYLFRKAVLEDKEAELERKNERERRQAENYPWDKEEALAGGVELTEEEQTRLLEEYEAERRNKSLRAEEGNLDKGNLTMKEKKDMVIVSSGTDMSQTSSSSKASTDGDWEKEFDLEEAENEAKKD